MKAHEVDVLAPTVLRDLEEVDHTLETRLSRQFGRDICEPDRQDRIHLDVPLVQAIAIPDFHVRAHPYSDAASDFAAPDSVTQAFGEDHRDSLLVLFPHGEVERFTQERDDRAQVLCGPDKDDV
jgi:hypothetical protein